MEIEVEKNIIDNCPNENSTVASDISQI